MKKHTFYYLFLLFSISPILCAQQKLSASEVLNKAVENYKNKTYISYNSNYSLYRDYNTKKVYEQYQGIVLRKNGVNYIKIKNTEFVSFNDYGLKISHDQKSVLLQKGNDKNGESPMSIEAYTKGFSMKLLPSNSNYYVCELSPPKISQIMLHRVLLYINKADYSISKQVLYLVERTEFVDDNGKTTYTVPRLEISFSKREKNEVKDIALTSKANYFTQKGDQIVLSKKISKYKLFKS